MEKRLSFLPILFVLYFLFGTTSASAADQSYINKTYVDSTVQRAFFNLSAATDVLGMGMKMEDAVAFAKQTITRLKTAAKGNPNEKYILWKVNELEAQVYLEENGMLLDKKNKNLKQANSLIDPFNKELGKSRPDFSELERLCRQMAMLDGDKEYEMQASVLKRKKDIGREAVASLENALADKKYDIARIELSYIKDQSAYLGFQLANYSSLAAKVQAHVTLDEERSFLTTSAKTAEDAIKTNSYGQARSSLSLMRDRIDAIKPLVLSKEYNVWFFREKNLNDALVHKEDSLVKVNLGILKDQGVVAAGDYLENVLRKLSVSREKIGAVDLAILEKAMAGRAMLQDTSVARQLAALPPAVPDDDSTTLFSDMKNAARKKAQENESGDFSSTQRRTHAEELRLTNMRLLTEGQKQRNGQALKDNKDRATKLMIEIYTLIEKKNFSQANDLYLDRQAFLARYVSTQDFSALDSAVISKERMAKAGKR